MTATVCPFCVLDDPLVTVSSDAHVHAVVSRAPINRYHVIIVQRHHVERLPDVPPDVAVSVWSAAREVPRAITAVAPPRGQ